MSEAYRDRNSSTMFGRCNFESDNGTRLNSFGCPLQNNGWIECASLSFPGKNYYFNVDSCCSTWGRPVSKSVELPKHSLRPLHLESEEDFLDEAPLAVSDIEDEDEDADDSIVTRKNEIYAQVLFKLYHCYEADSEFLEGENDAPSPIENRVPSSEPCDEDNDDNDTNDNFSSLFPEACYSNSSDDESSTSSESSLTVSSRTSEFSESDRRFKSMLATKRKNTEILTNRKKFVPVTQNSCFACNSRETVYSDDSEDSEEDRDSSPSINSGDTWDVGSRKHGLSSDDENNAEDEDESDDIEENDGRKQNGCLYSLPKLKVIEFADLVTESSKKRRRAKRRNDKINEISRIHPPKKTKIVIELNGVKTVNYDYTTPELPFGIKATNLSDSGSNSEREESPLNRRVVVKSENPEEGDDTKVETKVGILDCFKDFSEPDLSDSSTSSGISLETKRAEFKKLLFAREPKKLSDDSSTVSSGSSYKCPSSDDYSTDD